MMVIVCHLSSVTGLRLRVVDRCLLCSDFVFRKGRHRRRMGAILRVDDAAGRGACVLQRRFFCLLCEFCCVALRCYAVLCCVVLCCLLWCFRVLPRAVLYCLVLHLTLYVSA